MQIYETKTITYDKSLLLLDSNTDQGNLSLWTTDTYSEIARKQLNLLRKLIRSHILSMEKQHSEHF